MSIRVLDEVSVTAGEGSVQEGRGTEELCEPVEKTRVEVDSLVEYSRQALRDASEGDSGFLQSIRIEEIKQVQPKNRRSLKIGSCSQLDITDGSKDVILAGEGRNERGGVFEEVLSFNLFARCHVRLERCECGV